MISAKAYLGSVFWRKMPVRMKFSDVVVHEKYVNINNHDIALAKLENPVNFTDFIQPVQLPSKSEKFYTSTLFVPGFGDTKNASQSMLYMRFIRMKEITNEECSEAWGWQMDEKKMCGLGIDNINHTTCKGDSGNGIVTKDEKGAKVLGIVSYGPPGCLGKPKVFTRVSKYLDFIHAVTKIDIED
jgi:secreted trypsin-like serine protease